MTKNEIIRAWKDPKLRAAGVATPAGERASEAELKNVAGASSHGYWYSVSGECWGFNCNPFGFTLPE